MFGLRLSKPPVEGIIWIDFPSQMGIRGKEGADSSAVKAEVDGRALTRNSATLIIYGTLYVSSEKLTSELLLATEEKADYPENHEDNTINR